MKILIACEFTQIVHRSFTAKGHNVLSCDLSPGELDLPHYQGNVFDILNDSWDLIIAFPPCTYLAKAQMWRCNHSESRALKRKLAVEFVDSIWKANCPRIVIENPVGYLNNNWQKPTDIISPHMFGSKYYKEICLWQKGVPPLMRGALYTGKFKRVANHVNSSMSQDLKSKIKSRFFPQVADAMANQWSNLC